MSFSVIQVPRIIPAYAGSTRDSRMSRRASWDHPRIRGEHERLPGGVGEPEGSSPHTRGARPLAVLPYRLARIIPAYAGSTLVRSADGNPDADHPRIRGEHRRRRVRHAEHAGSSPHTRGAPRAWPTRCSAASDHPRIRGEHAVFVGGLSVGVGSSPHTRGALLPNLHRHTRRRIIPAYAGSTPSAPSGRRSPKDHPRIRGEHKNCATRWAAPLGSSPHTRGAPGVFAFLSPGAGIIPAYAGSTGRHDAGERRGSDHPRIRGEHVWRGFVLE